MSRAPMMAFALAALAGGSLPAVDRRHRDDDDPEPDDWNERRAWMERQDALAYHGPALLHPRPLPPEDLARWQAAQAKRARKASKRRQA